MTVAEVLLNEPRTRCIADSLRIKYKMANKKESNRLAYDLMNNYQMRLVDSAAKCYAVGFPECKQTLDSVHLIMRALGSMPEYVIVKKRKIKCNL